MIKKIEIKNFLSHAETKLVLNPGVNVIVGSGGSGKSSIVRALFWCIFNKPVGDSFISWGEKEAKIKLTVKEGIVIRKKSSSFNGYVVKKGRSLFNMRAIGTTVPNEVNAVLNMKELNVQQQDDSPYFIGESSKIGEKLAEAANLTIIPKSLIHIKREINETKKEISFLKNELAINQNKLKKYKGINTLSLTAKQINKRKEELKKKKEKVEKIEKIILKRECLKKENTRRKSLVQHKESIILLDKRNCEFKKTKKRKEKLLHITKDYKKILPFLDKLKSFKQDKTKVNLLVEKLKEKNKKQEKLKEIHYLIKKIKEYTQEKDYLISKINAAKDTFNKKMPKICPLCGRGEK